MNTSFSVILGFIPRIHAKHLANVILGLVPRIHSEQNLSRHYRACPDNLDPRVRPEDDNRRRMCFTPEYDADLMVDTRDRLFVTPEYDKCTIFKGLDVVRQCAALLERRVQSSTRVRKAQAVTRQTNECIETAESGVDKVVSSYEKNPNVHKTYMNFLRQRKTALDAPLHTVSSGRSMIEMLGVLAIIGVLSVGGIAGYSKAMMQFKINKLKQAFTEIITNTRTLYAQQKDFNGLYTDVAISTGIIPDYLSTDQYGFPQSPFGGYIYSPR